MKSIYFSTFFLIFFYKYFQFVYPNCLGQTWRRLWCLIKMQNFTIQKRNIETCHQNDSCLENITVSQGSLVQFKQHQGIRKEWLTCPIHQINRYRPTQPLSHIPHRCTHISQRVGHPNWDLRISSNFSLTYISRILFVKAKLEKAQ